MKRSSPNYVRYLESLVKALLTERAQKTDLLGDIHGEDGTTYDPSAVREKIAKMEGQIATIQAYNTTDAYRPQVTVPEAFAYQVKPDDWVKIHGKWERRVLSMLHVRGVTTLVLSGSGDGIEIGQTIEII